MIHTLKMEFLKNLFGINKLEKQISQNKSQITKLEKLKTQVDQNKTKATKNSAQIQKQKTKLKKIKTTLDKPSITKAHKTKTLQILKTPTSTTALSKSLKITRSYASKILNQLEKQNKIYEHSKKGRTILYKKH